MMETSDVAQLWLECATHLQGDSSDWPRISDASSDSSTGSSVLGEVREGLSHAFNDTDKLPQDLYLEAMPLPPPRLVTDEMAPPSTKTTSCADGSDGANGGDGANSTDAPRGGGEPPGGVRREGPPPTDTSMIMLPKHCLCGGGASGDAVGAATAETIPFLGAAENEGDDNACGRGVDPTSFGSGSTVSTGFCGRALDPCAYTSGASTLSSVGAAGSCGGDVGTDQGSCWTTAIDGLSDWPLYESQMSRRSLSWQTRLAADRFRASHTDTSFCGRDAT
mmetsp:Transcript_83908/g.218445  ORF Transcript_83908/g.218445 Transcript_83908/m.218445 type:complete len:278 (-) Transcript_83908:41-874(-)